MLRWATKGGLALADQGLVTGSNFLISVLLARWLTAGDYGAYAVAFAVYLLVIMLYQSLFLEPMAVFGASGYRPSLRSYFKSLFLLHIVVSLIIFVAVIIAAGIAFQEKASGSLGGALAGIAIAGPLVLMSWLVKRVFYIQLSPGLPAVAAFIYCAIVIGGLAVGHKYQLLSPFSALLLMGIAALASTIPLLIYLKRKLPRPAKTVSVSETWSRHWQYGRWALGSSALQWVPNSIFYPIVSTVSGMAEAGQLRALMNFSTPIIQGYSALISLLLPYAARIHQQKGYSGSSLLSRWISSAFLCGTVIYWSVLLLFREPAFHALYSGKYSEVTYLLPIVALGSVFWGAFVGPATVLRAMESPSSILVAVGVASVISVSVGVPGTIVFGIRGALWAITLSQALGLLVAHLLLRRKVQRARSKAPLVRLMTPLDLPSDSGSNSI
jgi:O-antigen/teichoic acid export membrane protein